MATTISNVSRINAKFEKLIKKAKENLHPVVIVGYTANYALFVHENIEMKWRGLPRQGTNTKVKVGNKFVFQTIADRKELKYTESKEVNKKGNYWDGTGAGKGQAKFLEQPFREMKLELKRLIETAVENGATLMQALYIAGLRLQRESQLLVPIDTGNLKSSAFTRKVEHN